MNYPYKLCALLCCCLWLLNGCTQAPQSPASGSTTLAIGVTPGPQAEIMTFVQGLAQQKGLELELVEYRDYVQPNVDVHRGRLWGNSLQHAPYLADTLVKEPKLQLAAAFPTISYPLALYPGQRKQKLQLLASLTGTAVPEQQKPLVIGLPNDPTNCSRALQLLAAARQIKLQPNTGQLLTLNDVLTPPQQIQLVPLDAAQLPRLLDQVDLAVLSCNYALLHGLEPARDALFMESATNPYVNVFVTRQDALQDPRLQQLAELYRSQATKNFILEHYQGAILPSW